MSDHRNRLLDDIRRSSAYRLAEEDTSLLKRDELRGIRLMLEYLKPELIQNEQNVNSTIVVFGSSRIPDPELARAQVDALAKQASADPSDAELQQRLEVARRLLAKGKYYEQARELGRIVSSACQVNGQCEFVVVTGGGPGIMEAANRGAFDVHCKSMGMNITLPNEQEPNPYISPELCFDFHYFAIRKMHLLNRACALIAFPGGLGTLDELFEALTLVQTEKTPRIPVILFGREFWDQVVNWQFLVDEGVISPEDLDLFEYAETAQQAWDIIVRKNGQRIDIT